MPSRILLGCVIGVLSSATQSIGLTLQRKSHLQHEQLCLQLGSPHHQQAQAIYKRPLWRLGFSLFMLANLLGSSVQISTLPLIILSPLQAIGLVFNSLCACILLDEEFSITSVVSMVSIGFGALFIAYFGSADDDSGRELAELLRLLKRDHFVAWLIVSGVVVVILFTYLSLVKFHRKRKDAHKVDWLPCVDFGLAEFKILKGCAYGVISGTLSAHSLLFAKISVEIIINSTINHDHSLQNIRSWFIIFTFLSLAIIQLFFLNKGLKNISTSILYPVVFCTYNIINITNGLIFYNKLETLTIAQIFMIVLGTALVLAGVFALSWRLKDENEPDSQFTRDSDQKVQRSSSSVNSETRSLLKSDDEEVGYVSFASPSKVGEVSPVSPFGGDMFDDNLRKTSFGSHYSNNNITPFKYGSILDDGRNNNLIVTRTRRVLSFEQNELLQQLKADPDL